MKIDILVIRHFVFILATISKCQKWVRRSNIILIVNLNMVYLGAYRSKKHAHFWAQSKKWWDTTQSNLIYMSAGKCRGSKSSNRIELSQFVEVLLHFYWFGPPVALGRGQGNGGYLGVWDCSHMHTRTYTFMYAQTYRHVDYMLKYTCREIANGCQHVYHD